MHQKYKLGIIEDDEALAQTLQTILLDDPRVSKVSVAYHLKAGLELIATEPLDFLIVDIGLPDGNGISAIYATRTNQPDCNVVVYSVFDDDRRLFEALQAGAHGYIQKQDTSKELLTNLLSIQEGCTISPVIAKRMISFFSDISSPLTSVKINDSRLSERETEVLKFVSHGKSLSEISVLMHLSKHTIKTYMRRIYEKLQVNSKLQAVQKAKENLWI